MTCQDGFRSSTRCFTDMIRTIHTIDRRKLLRSPLNAWWFLIPCKFMFWPFGLRVYWLFVRLFKGVFVLFWDAYIVSSWRRD
ncbi:hypothetical protein B0O99DRAFT_632558 [Bisporella sp. PMI_857]|nr:hypothetical protein B0O99DRAFT_632558 [Bisporella sp. PMI_857]